MFFEILYGIIGQKEVLITLVLTVCKYDISSIISIPAYGGKLLPPTYKIN